MELKRVYMRDLAGLRVFFEIASNFLAEKSDGPKMSLGAEA